MPRKAKDEEEKIVNSKPKTKKASSTSSTKKTTASKKSVPKTTTKKSTSSKKSSNSKETKTKKATATKKADLKTTTAKKATVKKAVAEKKSTTKKSDSEKKKTVKTTKTVKKVESKPKTTKSKTEAKKSTSKAKKDVESKPVKSTKKSTTTRKRTSKKVENVVTAPLQESTLEYYDLPFRYNETVVKLLAQTPKKLFIYWDISDSDRQNLISNFGEEFFNNTKPVLIIHNENSNKSFEIEINDFANCWYLDVEDTSVKYKIELGRRSNRQDYYIPNNYIYLASSNELESPNDHILFEKLSNTVYFRNVKTNVTYPKNIANMSFIQRMGKIYNIYDAYKKLYGKIYGEEDFLNNPSSGFMNF